MGIQPPPRTIDEFNQVWKDWLFYLWEQAQDLLSRVIILEDALAIDGTTLKVTEVSTTYTSISTDEVIHADPASASFTLTLETGTANRRLYVKNANTTNANTVTVAGTIDGATNFILTPLEALHLSYNTTKSSWMII